MVEHKRRVCIQGGRVCQYMMTVDMLHSRSTWNDHGRIQRLAWSRPFWAVEKRIGKVWGMWSASVHIRGCAGLQVLTESSTGTHCTGGAPLWT